MKPKIPIRKKDKSFENYCRRDVEYSGTRTGRWSTHAPNFSNVPKTMSAFDVPIWPEYWDKIEVAHYYAGIYFDVIVDESSDIKSVHRIVP